MKIRIINNLGNSIDNLNIRWDLSDQQIWIGDVQDYFEVEKLIQKTYGSSKWLHSDSQTLLFDKEKLTFMIGIIDVMEPIEVIE